MGKSRWDFKNANELTKELLSDEFRRGDAPRPVGQGKYTKLIDYKNAQIILIGAREGKDVIKNEIGIEIDVEENAENDSQIQQHQRLTDIFNKLKLRKDQIPIRPLIEGRLE